MGKAGGTITGDITKVVVDGCWNPIGLIMVDACFRYTINPAKHLLVREFANSGTILWTRILIQGSSSFPGWSLQCSPVGICFGCNKLFLGEFLPVQSCAARLRFAMFAVGLHWGLMADLAVFSTGPVDLPWDLPLSPLERRLVWVLLTQACTDCSIDHIVR